MADHYAYTLDLLAEVESLRDKLLQAYEARDAKEISQLHQDIGASLKLADIHATLSVRQALFDRDTDRVVHELDIRPQRYGL